MISVVVPAFNAADTLDACLQSLLDQSVPRSSYEIIVVDDGSLDRTAEVAARYQDRGICLVRQANQGPAAARNAGAAMARGSLLLFTDSDCAPHRCWIEHLSAAFDAPEVIGAKGTYLTKQTSAVARFVQVEYESRYDRMVDRERIDFIDTYSAAYRRDIFLQNGGFDPALRYLEDQEFSFRLAEKGYMLIFVPQAQVYHRHDRDVPEYFERKFTIGVWKARVTRRYPERIATDSHTPPALKMQIVCLLLATLLLVASFLGRAAGFGAWLPLRALSAGAGVVFVLSALPFLAKAWRRDRGIALIAPFMLIVRALALGTGYAVGSLRFFTLASSERPLLSARDRLIKRLIDLLGASVGLLVGGPLALAIALAIKLDSPGPVFYAQDRVGANGRTFRLIKFRTMVQDAEARLGELVDLDSLDQPAFKLPNDPRVTRVGRLLRRTSLDEWPQFLNVLRGEMSLVGPRPEEVRVVRLYDNRQRRRLAVKPGMTGPMQVNGRADLTLAQRLNLELDYIEHYSLGRDLAILCKTVPAVLRGQGAY